MSAKHFTQLSYKTIIRTNRLPHFAGNWIEGERIAYGMIEKLRTERTGPLSLAALIMMSKKTNFDYILTHCQIVKGIDLRTFVKYFFNSFNIVGVSSAALLEPAVKQGRVEEVLELLDQHDVTSSEVLYIAFAMRNLNLVNLIMTHPNFKTEVAVSKYYARLEKVSPTYVKNRGPLYLPYNRASVLETYLFLQTLLENANYIYEGLHNSRALEIIYYELSSESPRRQQHFEQMPRIMNAVCGIFNSDNDKSNRQRQEVFAHKMLTDPFISFQISRLPMELLLQLLHSTRKITIFKEHVMEFICKGRSSNKVFASVHRAIPNLKQIHRANIKVCLMIKNQLTQNSEQIPERYYVCQASIISQAMLDNFFPAHPRTFKHISSPELQLILKTKESHLDWIITDGKVKSYLIDRYLVLVKLARATLDYDLLDAILNKRKKITYFRNNSFSKFLFQQRGALIGNAVSFAQQFIFFYRQGDPFVKLLDRNVFLLLFSFPELEEEMNFKAYRKLCHSVFRLGMRRGKQLFDLLEETGRVRFPGEMNFTYIMIQCTLGCDPVHFIEFYRAVTWTKEEDLALIEFIKAEIKQRDLSYPLVRRQLMGVIKLDKKP